MNINFLSKSASEEGREENLTAVLVTRSFSYDDLSLLKYARWLVYILVFSIPLFFLPWTSEVLEFNKQFLIFILAGAGLILYLGQVIRTGHLILKKSPANYAILIFLAAILLASLFSDFRYQSIFGGFGAGFYESLVSSVSFAVLFFLILNVFGIGPNSAREDASGLLNIFGLSLFLVLLLGTLQIFGLSVFKLFGISQQAFSTVGTFNSLGIMAAVLMILSLSKIGFKKGTYFGYVRIPAIFLSLFLLLLINWWVLWLAAISGLVFVLVSNSMSDWRVSNYFWPSSVILLAVVFMLLNFNLTGVLGIDLPIEIAPSFAASFEITRQVLVKDALFGVGPENFSLAFDLYKPVSINSTVFWNTRFSEAASELFNTAAAFGLVGFLAFMFLVWTVFRLGFKNYGLISVLMVLLAAFVLYPYNMTLGFSLWLLMGLLVLSISKKEDELVINLEKSPRHSLITSVSFVGVLVLAVIGFYYTTLRYVADIKFVRALAAEDIDRQTQLLADVVNLSGGEDTYSQSLASQLISRVGQELQNLSGAKTDKERQNIISRVQNFSATAINLSGEITRRHGENAANWFFRATVYENLINVVKGSDEWAVGMYREYSKLSPRDPVPYLRTGNIYLNKADFLRQLVFGSSAGSLTPQNRIDFQNQISESLRLAEENYQQAIELKPDYVLVIYNLGVVFERQGRVKDAVKQLELIRLTNPLDANVALQLGLLYYRDNQKDKSFDEFQRAIALFSDFSNARWYLALLYEERGNIESALGELYKIKELNPDNQVLQDKIDELEAGKRSIPPQRVTGVEPLEQGENQ